MFGVDLAPVEIALGQHVQSFDTHEFQDDALAVGVAIGLLMGLGELDSALLRNGPVVGSKGEDALEIGGRAFSLDDENEAQERAEPMLTHCFANLASTKSFRSVELPSTSAISTGRSRYSSWNLAAHGCFPELSNVLSNGEMPVEHRGVGDGQLDFSCKRLGELVHMRCAHSEPELS